MIARQEVSALIRLADGDTRVALMRLAELFDAHLKDCPHVEAPVAHDYHTSHYEQAMLDDALYVGPARGLVAHLEAQEARASVALDGDTQHGAS